jgi:predicted nucleotidyltransferase
MKTEDIKEMVKSDKYKFLREESRLGDNIILLGLGGSHAYGTSNEDSDVDIRGVALQQTSDLLGLTEFEQYINNPTDTTIYGFNKIVRLLLNCNPNVCEILGLREDHYFIKTEIGQELIDNKKLFISKRAIKSFGGYASAQLRRLQNAIARDSLPQNDKEKHIMKSVESALEDFKRKYEKFSKGSIKIYIDKAENEELETEIFVDADYKHLALRDYNGLWNVMSSVVRDYNKIGKRNTKKDDKSLNKHAMHLIRLFMMAIDIVENGEIITYREKDLELLMRIRNGGFMREDGAFVQEFYDMLSDYEERLERAESTSQIPKNPDMEAVAKFVESVNRRTIESAEENR